MAKRKRILEDHKQVGRKLLPPFNHMLGGFKDISWTRTVLPQLVWIGCVHNAVGHKRSVELLTSLARTGRKLAPDDKSLTFAFTTDFEELPEDVLGSLRAGLEKDGMLSDLQRALATLVAYYPDCPLRLLFEKCPAPPDDEGLADLKRVVGIMHDRYEVFTMMVQANATWLAFDSGLLKVAEGLPLASFPEIEKYPHTELSQQVASGVRTTVNMFCTQSTDQTRQKTWEAYFWNRGFEIEPCGFDDE